MKEVGKYALYNVTDQFDADINAHGEIKFNDNLSLKTFVDWAKDSRIAIRQEGRTVKW